MVNQEAMQQEEARENDEVSSQIVKSLPYDPNESHPLLHEWTLWYDSELSGGKRPTSWGENIKEIHVFSSIEDFWRLYNNIAPPSQLQQGCTYSLFKKGISPKWEDPANEKGGKWTLIIQKSKALLDKLWLWLLLACIGEILDEGKSNICGVVVNVRRGQDKLCLWTNDAENKDAILKVGMQVKKLLELPDNFPIGYQAHYQKNNRINKYEL